MEDTSSPKVEGLILRSSRSLYRLCRNFSFWYLHRSLKNHTASMAMTLQLLQAVGQMHRRPDATRLLHLMQPMLAYQRQLEKASAL